MEKFNWYSLINSLRTTDLSLVGPSMLVQKQKGQIKDPFLCPPAHQHKSCPHVTPARRRKRNSNLQKKKSKIQPEELWFGETSLEGENSFVCSLCSRPRNTVSCAHFVYVSCLLCQKSKQIDNKFPGLEGAR